MSEKPPELTVEHFRQAREAMEAEAPEGWTIAWIAADCPCGHEPDQHEWENYRGDCNACDCRNTPQDWRADLTPDA